MYFVRADGNAKIGAGHLMRCLTIAEELAKLQGGTKEICFLCADEASAALAEENGFRAQVLHTDYQSMESELPVLSEKLKGSHVILVDSYHVTDLYLKQLRAYGKVFLLDDMQQHAFPVDAVINYNAFAKEEIYQKLYQGTGAELFIGSPYVPVRPQFLQGDYTVAGEVREILITTGGGDVDNIAGAILHTIYEKGLHYHLVVGKYNPHLEELTRMSKERGGITLHRDVKDMAGLMSRCDLAITAGGTTIYELAAIGVPFVCFSYAENQEALTEFVGAQEIAGFAGAYHKDRQATLCRISQLVRELCHSQEMRTAFYAKERQLIDGRGASRLAQVLYDRR